MTAGDRSICATPTGFRHMRFGITHATKVFMRNLAHRATCVWICIALVVAQTGCAAGPQNLRVDSATMQNTAGPARASAADRVDPPGARSGEAGEPAAVSATESALSQEPDDGSTTQAARVAKGVAGGVLLAALIALMFAPLIILALR